MDSDTDDSLMDLDETEGNAQLTKESDDESVLSYTSQPHPSTPAPMVPSSEPVTPGAVSSSEELEEEKPKKKTVESAIFKALKISEEEKKLGKMTGSGLLKYFSRGTEEDRAAYFQREDEKAAAIRSQDEAYRKHLDAKKKL
jgi:hypothetical protein